MKPPSDVFETHYPDYRRRIEALDLARIEK